MSFIERVSECPLLRGYQNVLYRRIDGSIVIVFTVFIEGDYPLPTITG